MDSELAALMPNNLENKEQTSPLDTGELRKYIQEHDVLGERGNLPPQDPRLSRKHYISGLQPGPRVPRSRQARRFSIRVKREDTMANAALNDSQLDPEELKDALLQQAIAQRRALVAASLRPGSGRVVKTAPFKIVIELPPIVEEPQNLSPSTDNKPSPFIIPGLPNYPSPIEGVLERPPLPAPESIPMPSESMQAPPSSPHEIVIDDDGDDSPIEGLIHHRAAHNANTLKNVHDERTAAQTMADHEIFGPSTTAHATEALNTNDDDDMDDHDFGGYDDMGGDWGDWDDQDVPPLSSSPIAGAADAGPTASFQLMPPPPPRQPTKPRQPIRNPGIRLKNELPRKSLALDPHVGLREVAPGIRRSTRQAQEPLKWWLGEKKEFDRVAHKTMPTIKQITQAELNTPWRTVADPRLWKKSRKAYAPHRTQHANVKKSTAPDARRKGTATTAGAALAKKKRRQRKRRDAAGPSSKRHCGAMDDDDEGDMHAGSDSDDDDDDDIIEEVLPMPTMDNVVVEGSELQPIELLDEDGEEEETAKEEGVDDDGQTTDAAVVAVAAAAAAAVLQQQEDGAGNVDAALIAPQSKGVVNEGPCDDAIHAAIDNNDAALASNDDVVVDDVDKATNSPITATTPMDTRLSSSPMPSPSRRMSQHATAVYQNALAEDMIIDDEIILTAAQVPVAPSATPASVTVAGNGRGGASSATPASVTVAMPARSIGMALQGILEEGGDAEEAEAEQASPSTAVGGVLLDGSTENAYDDGEIVVASTARVISSIREEPQKDNKGDIGSSAVNADNDDGDVVAPSVMEHVAETDAAKEQHVVDDAADDGAEEATRTEVPHGDTEGEGEREEDHGNMAAAVEDAEKGKIGVEEGQNIEEIREVERDHEEEDQENEEGPPGSKVKIVDDEVIVTERRSLRAKNKSTRLG